MAPGAIFSPAPADFAPSYRASPDMLVGLLSEIDGKSTDLQSIFELSDSFKNFEHDFSDSEEGWLSDASQNADIIDEVRARRRMLAMEFGRRGTAGRLGQAPLPPSFPWSARAVGNKKSRSSKTSYFGTHAAGVGKRTSVSKLLSNGLYDSEVSDILMSGASTEMPLSLPATKAPEQVAIQEEVLPTPEHVITSPKAKSNKFCDEAYSILDKWWSCHKQNPYPTLEEKEMLCRKTGLTQKQVSTWFSNRRRRKRSELPNKPEPPQAVAAAAKAAAKAAAMAVTSHGNGAADACAVPLGRSECISDLAVAVAPIASLSH